MSRGGRKLRRHRLWVKLSEGVTSIYYGHVDGATPVPLPCVCPRSEIKFGIETGFKGAVSIHLRCSSCEAVSFTTISKEEPECLGKAASVSAAGIGPLPEGNPPPSET